MMAECHEIKSKITKAILMVNMKEATLYADSEEKSALVKPQYNNIAIIRRNSRN